MYILFIISGIASYIDTLLANVARVTSQKKKIFTSFLYIWSRKCQANSVFTLLLYRISIPFPEVFGSNPFSKPEIPVYSYTLLSALWIFFTPSPLEFHHDPLLGWYEHKLELHETTSALKRG